MSYVYKTKGTCSTRIEVELDGDIIKDVRFTGGCNGNLQAVSRLVTGRNVDEVADTLSGIRCGMRPTSCGDQLSKALLAAQKAQQE